MVLRGTTFHTEVPAFAGAEIDELLGKHAKVLPGDARRRPICFTVSVRTMARRAMVEKCFTIDCIGSGPQRTVEFPLRGGRLHRILCRPRRRNEMKHTVNGLDDIEELFD